MNSKYKHWMRSVLGGAAALCLAVTATAAPLGKIVPIGGHAADLALDEARGVLYIANFTANRVDVMSLGDQTVQSSINVASQPSSLAVSPDGKYLVIAHYGNNAAPAAPTNGLTVVNLETRARQTIALGAAPLGVAFGIDGKAFVATATDFQTFDPVTGTAQALDTIAGVIQKTLPQPQGSFPTNITTASMAASQDGLWIFGSTDTLWLRYDVRNRRVGATFYTAEPKFGPRTTSVSADGSFWTTGWARLERDFAVSSQFPKPIGTFNIGSTIIDSSRNLIYTHMPESETLPLPAPVLQVVDAENLGVIERLSLGENLTGKGVMSGDSNTAYVISDSGITVLPVGSLQFARRVKAGQEDVVFRGSFCDRRVTSQEITILDQSGAATDFSITSTNPAIRISPASGFTPARVRITVDPAAFGASKGTTSAVLNISSRNAVNLPAPVRVLVNTREPDQRGVFVNVPGKLVDIVSDPVRDRFFILRQDKNQVLVFDGATQSQIATLKVGNTPTQMAVTFDRRHLLVGADNSQLIYIFDLETLEPLRPLRMPPGHYPRSIATSGKATLVASRVVGPKHKVSSVDLSTRSVSELASLGVYENDINIDTTLVSNPNGSSVMLAQADGRVMLYNATADTFTISRKDSAALSGAFAASNMDQYIIGNRVLNASLVPVRELESGTGISSGFAFVDDQAVRLTAPNSAAAGVIQRVNVATGESIRATRMVEAPILNEQPSATGGTTGGSTGGSTNQTPTDTTFRLVFTRTIAPLASRSAMVALTTSGFTVLPANYDAAVAPPRIERVVNAADFSAPVAPGGLITVFGRDLSPVSQSSGVTPLPTVLGDSCLTVNGVNLPVIYVSQSQINAQLPVAVDGNTTLRLNTPGGVSDNFNLTIQPTAPSIFRTTSNGAEVPSVVRSVNNSLVTPSNPVHRGGDMLTIYATGLGRTSPAIGAGEAAPTDSLVTVQVTPVVTIGGVEVEVLFAGLAPGQVGVYQINVRTNDNVPLGLSVPLQISQGAASTSMNVRVVN